ncbi:MAG: maleylpyruvate isomerase family mycothiol-dependent enzyme, partial [Candidatus Binatia bacterium]
DELCSSLGPADWEAETDCPGWSVKDNLSHIVGTESMLLGRQAPDHDPGPKPWVHNPVGTNNEVQVDYRRSWPAEKVLEEFREVTGERMKALRAMSEAELDAESWTPIGQGTVRDLVAIRVMDCWVHEQDMRRATSKPGSLDGPVAEHAFARHSTALPFVVGKKVGPPEGTSVVFDVKGFGAVAVGTDGKRARSLDAVPGDPTVKLTMDLETFSRLCTGRGDAAALADQVTIEGDEALGRKIVGEMNFMI